MNYLYLSFMDIIKAEFEKLKMQKFVPVFLSIFMAAGLLATLGIVYFNERYGKISHPAETFAWWHSVLFQIIFTLCFVFVGTSHFCREFEKGMIKNIILTGISLPQYLFSRLMTFFGVLSAILLVTYTIDTALMLLYYGAQFDITVVGRGFFLTLLQLLQTLFLILLFSSLLKKTTTAIFLLLLYYMALEKIMVKLLISMTSYLNLSQWSTFILRHTPLQVLDNMETAVGGDYMINLAVFVLYLAIYGIIIWVGSRETELALVEK